MKFKRSSQLGLKHTWQLLKSTCSPDVHLKAIFTHKSSSLCVVIFFMVAQIEKKKLNKSRCEPYGTPVLSACPPSQIHLLSGLIWFLNKATEYKHDKAGLSKNK